jgi:hypothetical protein
MRRFKIIAAYSRLDVSYEDDAFQFFIVNVYVFVSERGFKKHTFNGEDKGHVFWNMLCKSSEGNLDMKCIKVVDK